MKGYTDFFGGILDPHESHADGDRYLDWKKAEQICKDNPHSTIYAGLREDWFWTSGLIFENGVYSDGGCLYNHSYWATPILDVDGVEIECWTNEPYDFPGVPPTWGNGVTVSEDFLEEHREVERECQNSNPETESNFETE